MGIKTVVKTIEQLLTGRYEYSAVPPHIAPEAVDEQTAPGEDLKGLISIESGDGQRLRGHGHVSNARIVLTHDRFTGTSFRVFYGIDVNGLADGDIVKGSIILSLNVGEIDIPVKVRVTGAPVSSGVGEIRSLDDFAALSRIDGREAYRMFADGRIQPLIDAEGPEIRALYRAMTVHPVTFSRMEEFLASAGKKEPVRITAEGTEASFEHLTESAQGRVRITKNTWGNIALTVRTDAPFLVPSQRHYMEDDFVGNTLDITYLVLAEELDEGQQRGRLIITADNDTVVVHVTASRHTSASYEERIATKRAIAGMCRDRIDHRVGRTDDTTYMKRCVPKIAYLRRTAGPDAGLDLMEAAAYEEVGAAGAAKNILKKWDGHDFGGEIAAFEAAWISLNHALGQSGLTDEELVEELRALYEEDEDSLLILTFLFRFDPDYRDRPGKRLTALSKVARDGVRSPFLFLEAAMTLRGNEHLLAALTPFTKDVLLFAVRNGLVTRDLALRTALLSQNEKTFSPAMFRILKESWKKYPLDDILEAICRLIIKGNPRREEFHEWFVRAVDRDIRITRLYEYYIETLPEHYRKVLPLKVRRYFTMNNTLGAGRKAMLFANIILNKNADPETYNDYFDAMSEFARKMLPGGSINEDFAILYSEFIPTLPTKEMAEAMASVMFRHVVTVDDPKIREVIVLHDAMKEEVSYALYRGRAYADIYTKDVLILFRDERGRKFRSGAAYSVRQLMDHESFREACLRAHVEEAGFLLHELERSGEVVGRGMSVTEWMSAVQQPEYTEEYRQHLAAKLLEYFSEHRDDDNIDLFLTQGVSLPRAGHYHALLAEVMFLRGMAREAFELLTKYGYDDTEPGLLCRITGRVIEKRDYEQDEELVLAAAAAFRNDAYDQKTLIYLVTWFEGSLKDMCAIRAAASAENINTKLLDERILGYSMLTRTPAADGPKIVRGYAAAGGARRVSDAYLTFEAMRSFMESTPLDAGIASALENAYDTGVKGQQIGYLALLRFYAGRNDLTEEEEKRRDRLFKEMVGNGFLFSFYAKFPLSLLQKYRLDDKMILECRALPTDRVFVRIRDPHEDGREREIPMRRMTGGIFSCALIAFSGDIVRYRIVIRRGDDLIEQPEEAIVMNSAQPGGRSRYQRICRMIAEKKQGDYEAFYETEKKYRMAVHAVDMLFPLS